MFGVFSRPATDDDLFLEELRQQVFEFGCGGRMAELWPTWGSLVQADRDHLCIRADVRQYCIAWPQGNAAKFSDIFIMVSNLASGRVGTVWKKWRAYLKREEVDRSVVLSGDVDIEGLKNKSSKRCQMLQRICL